MDAKLQEAIDHARHTKESGEFLLTDGELFADALLSQSERVRGLEKSGEAIRLIVDEEFDKVSTLQFRIQELEDELRVSKQSEARWYSLVHEDKLSLQSRLEEAEKKLQEAEKRHEKLVEDFKYSANHYDVMKEKLEQSEKEISYLKTHNLSLQQDVFNNAGNAGQLQSKLALAKEGLGEIVKKATNDDDYIPNESQWEDGYRSGKKVQSEVALETLQKLEGREGS